MVSRDPGGPKMALEGLGGPGGPGAGGDRRDCGCPAPDRSGVAGRGDRRAPGQQRMPLEVLCLVRVVALAARLAQQLLFGAQLGWMSLGGRSDNQSPPMGLFDLLMDEALAHGDEMNSSLH